MVHSRLDPTVSGRVPFLSQSEVGNALSYKLEVEVGEQLHFNHWYLVRSTFTSNLFKHDR